MRRDTGIMTGHGDVMEMDAVKARSTVEDVPPVAGEKTPETRTDGATWVGAFGVSEGAGAKTVPIAEMTRPRDGRPVPTKIPPHLRKRPTPISSDASILRTQWLRLTGDSHRLRTTVQVAFVLLCVWIGVEFHLFMEWGVSGGAAAFVERPPGAEGFLPISALISLKHWLLTGIDQHGPPVRPLHPRRDRCDRASCSRRRSAAGSVPIGTLSESLWMLGREALRPNTARSRAGSTIRCAR